MWYNTSMDGGLVQIIISAITVCVPALVTIITTKSVKRQANRNSARSSILTMILDDKIRMMCKEVPENYHAIHDEYDIYTNNYGNSWVHQKVEEYDKMIAKYEKKIANRKK